MRRPLGDVRGSRCGDREGMASVTFEDVSKAFSDDVVAVDRLDLEIADREFLVLLGPSGCGKSTSLRLIAGLEDCTTGEIRIDGHVVNHIPPKDRDIAMVFQNYALYPHMSVYKNLAFGLTLRYGGGWLARTWLRLMNSAEANLLAEKRNGIRQQVEETAKALRIERLLDRMPRQLSGGERQRVALGRAMVRQPAVFLFDEPLSNLDAKLRLETRRELKRLHQHLQTTMIYVTHDQTEALTLGQRIAVMNAGSLQQLGTPTEIYDRPKNLFVAGFVGSPPMNLIAGELRHADERVVFFNDHITISLPCGRLRNIAANNLPREKVTLGIRPEDVTITGSKPDGSASEPMALADVQTDHSPSVRGRVSMVESVGDTAFVHVVIQPRKERKAPPSHLADDAPDHTLVCKTNPRTGIQPGDLVEVAMVSSRVHLFDDQTEERLTL
ncbi:MAG: ATP-binding cassette domain-containing protein [Pirellulaceae bacterium]|nr:ATP-binding cassette domain-containing protein [Pirellulaceae bacterium]